MELSFEDVTVSLAGTQLVSELSMKAGSGELIGLVGPNGSGKSTTLRCAFRALRPGAGRITLDGNELHHMALSESARSLAALPQESHAEFDFTVSEVVEMGRAPYKAAEGDAEICAEALAEVGCEHLAERGFASLSGGEKQRVLIARALAQQPSVLVLDEPTNHLDIRHQLDVLALVRRLGLTTVTALHDLNLAASWCDRVYVLDGGRLVADGPPRKALSVETVREVFGVEAHVVEHPGTGAHQLLFQNTPEVS